MMLLPHDPSRDAARSVSPGWMITFADLLSLLVSFFVLLFATTAVPTATWQRVMRPIAGYMTGADMHATGAVPIAEDTAPARLDLNYVGVLITRLLAEDAALAGSTMERDDHALILHLRPGLSWSGASAPLTRLAQLLGSVDNRIEIEAHIANAIATPTTATAWPRAVALAEGIAAECARLGVTGPLVATGMVDLPEGATDRLDIVLYDRRAGGIGLPPTAATAGTGDAP